MIGTTVGRYRFVEQLGRGATGIVYKAVDETLDREVAIKILNPEVATPEIVKRFRAEATTLAKLNHPDIATIHELLPHGGDLLMVMECVRGETVEGLSRRVGALPVDQAVQIVDKILAALEHAHQAGIVHRDMKPANVMVTEAGGVKIMDFGIARVRGAEQMTLDGSMMGTPAYMAPEQVLGRDVDQRADLYSVGVLFYRLLTGALPFNAESPMAMLQRQIADPPTPLHVHRSDLPAWCEPVMQRALAKSPDDRFQSAAAFRDALRTPAAAAQLPRAAAQRFPLAKAAAAAVAAIVLVLAFFTMRSPAASMPPVTFKTKALVGTGSRQQERDGQLVLADGAVTVTAGNGANGPLYSVPYDGVLSISYSKGRNPMWNSPDGPAPAARATGGTLGRFGIFVERHWVTLQVESDNPLMILRFDDHLVGDVLIALEERTGVTPKHLGARD